MLFAPTRSCVALLFAPPAPVVDNKAHKHLGENAEGILQVSYHELMTVLVEYTQSNGMPETLIKLYLPDNLEKINKLRMAG